MTKTYLDEHLEVLKVFSTPSVEGLKQLQAVTLRVNIYFQTRPIRWWVLVGVLTWIEIKSGKLISCGRHQFKLLSIGGCEKVSLRVELQCACNGKGCDDLQDNKLHEKKEYGGKKQASKQTKK